MRRTFFAFMALMFVIVWIQMTRQSLDLVDLGVARFPTDAGVQGTGAAARITVHDWRAPRKASPYRLTYAHGHAAASELEADHERLANLFALQNIGENSFRWQPPVRCVGSEWECIYSSTLARSAIDLDPVLDLIDRTHREEGWNTAEAARWLLAFVQQIPYKVPQDHAFGLLPPALVTGWDWGDCDSKSLLLIQLLDRVGIDAVLLVSEAHHHAVVGIAVPSAGVGFEYLGREYAWAETTTERAPLGWLHPGLKSPNDWHVVPIEMPDGRGTDMRNARR